METEKPVTAGAMDAPRAAAEPTPQATPRLAQSAPSLDEVRELAASGAYLRIPIKRELYADEFTTIECIRRLRAASHHVFLLESAEADQRWGRYSFLGCDPTLEISCLDGHLRVRSGDDVLGGAQVEEREVEHPGEYIRQVLADHASPQLEGFPPFAGGLVGYFSYDYLKYAEPTLRELHLAHEDFLDVDLMLFDSVIAFDTYRQKLVLITGVDLHGVREGVKGTGALTPLLPDQGGVKTPVPLTLKTPVPLTLSPTTLEEAYAAAVAKLDELEGLVREGERKVFAPLKLTGELAPMKSRDEFCQMVERAQHYIHEGDIFQVVLSNPITAPATGSLFDTYRALRSLNPSPYMFYFSSDDVEIAGASPETLAQLSSGRLYTYPLAGTRPRGATRAEDEALEAELLTDKKELAEHNMLVDLGRNDLGRIARIGSVEVERYLQVLRFSHVMHIGSTVAADIAEGRDAVDAIDSILPAGTLSGAPKIRACQIIGELEGEKRGIYGGAIGYLDFAGNMDTCIAIRLAYKKDGRVVVQSGAGIVKDSVPATEFDETQNKARAVLGALLEAEGGLA